MRYLSFYRFVSFFLKKKIFETFDISMTDLFSYGKHFLGINDHLKWVIRIFLVIFDQVFDQNLDPKSPIFELYQAYSKLT